MATPVSARIPAMMPLPDSGKACQWFPARIVLHTIDRSADTQSLRGSLASANCDIMKPPAKAFMRCQLMLPVARCMGPVKPHENVALSAAQGVCFMLRLTGPTKCLFRREIGCPRPPGATKQEIRNPNIDSENLNKFEIQNSTTETSAAGKTAAGGPPADSHHGACYCLLRSPFLLSSLSPFTPFIPSFELVSDFEHAHTVPAGYRLTHSYSFTGPAR